MEKKNVAAVDAAFLLSAGLNQSEWDMFVHDVSVEEIEYVVGNGPDYAKKVVRDYQYYVREIYNSSEMSRMSFYRLRHKCSSLEELEREVLRLKAERACRIDPPEFALLNHEILNALSGVDYDEENVRKNRWKKYTFDGPGLTFTDVVVLSAIYKWIGSKKLSISIEDILDVIFPKRRHDENTVMMARGWVKHLLSSLEKIRLYKDDVAYRADEFMLCAEFENDVLKMPDVPAFHSLCDGRWIKMPDIRGVRLERISVIYILKRIDRIKNKAASTSKMLFSTAAKVLGYSMDINKLNGCLKKMVGLGILKNYKVTPRGVEFEVNK